MRFVIPLSWQKTLATAAGARPPFTTFKIVFVWMKLRGYTAAHVHSSDRAVNHLD